MYLVHRVRDGIKNKVEGPCDSDLLRRTAGIQDRWDG